MTTALTIGNFDGVHRGHAALVEACRRHGEAVAMFFDPHPAEYFGRGGDGLLTTPARRAAWLRAGGASRVDIRPFDGEFASQTPETFVKNVVVRDHGAQVVVVGPDFRFGKGAVGDVPALRAFGSELGFAVEIADAVLERDEVISSTRIRRALLGGDVRHAAELLGRSYVVDSTVVKGDQRGRTLGFPTANLGALSTIVPKDGVYAVAARVNGARLFGMANLGTRPTFEAGRSVEVHLFDFAADLYDAPIAVAFLARLRDEQKFDGLDALVAQLKADEREARACIEKFGDLEASFAAYGTP
ncbi:MAG: bifunctional riboflavin kinase/FAD synthetase [Myxococcota bacterium]